MLSKYNTLAKFIGVFILCFFIVFVALADPCDPIFDKDGVQILKADGSPVCESDTTAIPHSDTCIQAFNDDGEPLLQYAKGDPSFNPAKLHYCPDDPIEEPDTETLQYIDDIDKNPLNLPVAGLPYNIPTPGYQVPGGGGCGNGFLDPGEECDFGPNEIEGVYAFDMEAGQLHEDENGLPIVIIGNDDTTPNWCRSNCTLPQFGDGVVDFSYGENEDVNGNEVSIANDQQWIDFVTLFRNDPGAYYEQFVSEEIKDANPGPNGPPPEQNGETLVCDVQDFMCKPISKASSGSTVPCTKNEDCGHLDCVNMSCQRVAGSGDPKCSKATEIKDCAHLGCSGITCKLLPGKGANTCKSHRDCWGSSCSKYSATCIPVPIDKSDSTCGDDSDCSSQNNGNSEPGSDPASRDEDTAPLPAPTPPPGTTCNPASVCDPNKCPNWCEINLNGACTGTMQDWCLHPDNQCKRQCTELYSDFDYRTTVFKIRFLIFKVLGEHVGGGFGKPSWVSVNRFDKSIVCDDYQASANDFSGFKKYFNHGRTFIESSLSSKSQYEWVFEGPTCVEKKTGNSGYVTHLWYVKPSEFANMPPIPQCILDGTGASDCDATWKDRQLTAITSSACIHALNNADFFCDTLCANDGYALPYNEIKKELNSSASSFFVSLMHVPKVSDSDSYGNKGSPLWNYLALSGYLASWKDLSANDWTEQKARLIAKWEEYHKDKEPFTCKGAFGEAPENHFAIHKKFTANGKPSVKVLSTIQAHNSNTDAAAQLKLAEHCKFIDAPEQGVDLNTSGTDWEGVHGDHIITDICDNVCGGDDARLDIHNLARQWAPVVGSSVTLNSAGPPASKSFDEADYWDTSTAMSTFSSTVTGSQCASISSNAPFCDAKQHTKKSRGTKKVKGM